ncbi:hypothetical protein ACCI51_19340 [Microbulbifer echini]|uniref:Lipoprotein n=1 Tax=Microbulbifer echini TaxID=1529067 RepID=A0ABV4NT22_9GAMM
MKRVFILASLVMLSSCSTIKASDPFLDEQLVGDWVGERENVVGCDYYSWATKRNSDGTYQITFYEDSNRTVDVHSESGRWWVKESVFYNKSESVMKEPDAYDYKVISSEIVEFNQISADQSVDCMGDYSFKDIRR